MVIFISNLDGVYNYKEFYKLQINRLDVHNCSLKPRNWASFTLRIRKSPTYDTPPTFTRALGILMLLNDTRLVCEVIHPSSL